jgi:hypothetical protein
MSEFKRGDATMTAAAAFEMYGMAAISVGELRSLTDKLERECPLPHVVIARP